MKETIQKLCELDNHPIVLTDDDRKDGSDPQRAKSEQFKNANEEMHDPIRILQLSDCDRHFKQIEDCFSANDRKNTLKISKWNWPWRSKQGFCMAKKTM